MVLEARRPALESPGAVSQPWMDSMQRQILLDAFGVPKGCWGWVGGRLMGAWNRPINELTTDLLDVGPRDRVLEIGYGPDTALALVGARASEGLVVGVDPSAVMARQAYRRNRP